jgi:hypothetical protein
MLRLPCPFCGSKPVGCFTGILGINVTAVCCPDKDCIASARQVSIEQWNTRLVGVPEVDQYKEKYEKLLAFVQRARQESDLVSIQSSREDFITHKIQVPYWFMRDPE